MAKSNLIDVEVTFEHATAKAFLVTPNGKIESVWVSKQYCEIDPAEDELVRGVDAMITVEKWFAEKIGLI